MKIHLPGGKISNTDKFAKDIHHTPFYDDTVIGAVTSSYYSLRRGVSSGLGLLSIEAIKNILSATNLQNDPFLLAVENERNSMYYVGNYHISYPNAI